ncbi:hypothetical protein MTX78_17590 [Hymenobacter tibetensis]|uniref:PorT family protein n=1 Tax=Hymenobacter tibetensis TaxID=497967 RepID=A0ABY4CV59_9BACT|nr:hypothetical protein [Hymenobacter tibetensis]UOG73922.1 hypothetical protein MTX78_17590 [Hymenobacter tibetensis]
MGSTAAVAQTNFRPGYVLQLSGDTLRGEVDARNEQRNRQLCRFRSEKNGVVSEYQPEQVRGYGVGDKNYQSRSIPGASTSKVFLQLLVPGNVSLYRTVLSDDREAYYASKESDPSLRPLIQSDSVMMKYSASAGGEVKTMVRSYPFRSQLALLMADCPRVQPSIATMELREQKLLQVVADYNVCATGSAQVAKPTRSSTVAFSVLAGGLQSNLTLLDNGQSIALEAGRQAVFGAGLELKSGFLHYKLSAVFQALYVKQPYYKHYESNGEGIFSADRVQKDAYVNFTSIRVPLLLRYTILQGAVRPYLQAGAIGVLHSESHARIETMLPRFNTTTVRDIELRKYGIGPSVGAGLSFPTGKVGSVQVEIRAEWLDSSSQASQVLSGASSVALVAGYTFGGN